MTTCVYTHDQYLSATINDGQSYSQSIDQPVLAQTICLVFHNIIEVCLGTTVKHSWNHSLNYLSTSVQV